MCSIAGVYSKKGEDVYPFLLDMILMMSHRGSDGFGITVEKNSIKNSSHKKLADSHLKGSFGVAHSLLSITGHGLQPFSSCKKDFSVCHNGQIYNYLELNKKLSKHNFESDSDSETIAHFLEENDFDLKKFMINAKGSYSVGVCKKDGLLAFRDPVGIRPLWFGENERFFGFASEPIALKKLGIFFPQPLLPGHSLSISKKGIIVNKVFSLLDLKKSLRTKSSFEELFSSFKESVFVRTKNIKKAGVLFSGGVDSSLVARLVSDNVSDVGLFCCGLDGSEDLVFADKVASKMGLVLYPKIVKKDEVSELAIKCLTSLGFFDEMQLGIALPEYGACELAKSKGFKVIFSGQGSDELFAGYSFFKTHLKEKGYVGVQEEIWSNLLDIWSKNLFRDDIISMRHSLELRVPFLDTVFLRHAMSFPASKKILSHTDELRKHPVRKMAELSGVPSLAFNRPKKAMQYGSGFAREVAKLV